MEIKRYEGNGRMSKAVVHGDTLYLCGQTAREGGDVKDQTRIVLEKIEALLGAYGSDKRYLLTATIYLKDMKDFAAMNEVWDGWIEDGFEPARACVEASLASESLAVEIVVTAALK